MEVELLRRRYQPGGARRVPVTFAQTEALGVFQLRDVVPGEYYVRAYVPTSIRPTRGDTSVAYSGHVLSSGDKRRVAQAVSVASGQEVSGVDFSLVTTRMRTVSGRLVDSDGRSLSTAGVSLLPMGNGPVQMPKSNATADGRFRIDGVTPGEYMLSVTGAPTRSWIAATRQISVVDDVIDLVLAAGPSVSIEGRIVRDDGRSAVPFDLRTLNIVLERHFGSQMTFGSGMVRNLDADGTFTLRAGAATVYLQVGRLPPPWSVKRATLDEVDVTDGPFDLRGRPRPRDRVDRSGQPALRYGHRSLRPRRLERTHPRLSRRPGSRWDDARLSDRISAIRHHPLASSAAATRLATCRFRPIA